MGFRGDLRFLVGALGHGMDFEDAYNIYAQAKAGKQERKDEKRAALANLLTAGTSLAQTVTNDESLTDLLGMYGKAYGARPGQVSKVAGALTQMSDPTEWLPEDTDALGQRFMPVIEGMVARGDSVQAIRQQIREQVQRENPEYQDEAVWSAVRPSFDAALESMLLSAGKVGGGFGAFRQNAAARASVAPTAAPQNRVGAIANALGGGGSPSEMARRVREAVTPEPDPVQEPGVASGLVGAATVPAMAAYASRPASRAPGVLGKQGFLRNIADRVATQPGRAGQMLSPQSAAGPGGFLSRAMGGASGVAVAPAVTASSLLSRFAPETAKSLFGVENPWEFLSNLDFNKPSTSNRYLQ